MNKVLIIGLSAERGGIETFFHNYYEGLAKNDIHFDFIASDGSIAFGDEYKKTGSRIYEVPSFKRHPLIYYRLIKRIIKENHYDTVHINMLSAANILPIMAARAEKVPRLIIHAHNNDTPSGIIRKVLDKANHIYIRKIDAIRLACSKDAGKWMFGKSANFRVIINAINIKKFSFNQTSREYIRHKYGVKDNDILLGNVGRLCEQKNQVFLPEVLEELSDNYKLMLIGSGVKKNEIIKKASKHGLEDRIIIIDNVSDIEKYYNAFDLFVFPSLFEGLGTVLVEAQANGLKCLASNVIPDEANLGGIVKLPLDRRAWKAQIEKCSKRNSYNCTTFDIQKNLKEFYDLYVDKKVSIIVPVYNNKCYLEKCLDSILAQTYRNIELIIVDDGSSDGSEKIAKKYSLDQRVKYIRQKNSGAYISRLNGIKASTGDYLMFVDSDDWIEKDAVSILVHDAEKENADIVRFNHYIEPGHKEYKLYHQVKGKTIVGDNNIKSLILTNYNARELAFGFYNRQLFDKTKLATRKMSYGEDYFTNIQLMSNAKKILFSKKSLYHYLKNNNNSTTSTKDKRVIDKNFSDSLMLAKKIYEVSKSSRLTKKGRIESMYMILDVIMWPLYNLSTDTTEPELNHYLEKIENERFFNELKSCSKEIKAIAKYKSLPHFFLHRHTISGILEKNAEKILGAAKRRSKIIGRR